MVEKTSEKFLGKTTKFLGFKREKNGKYCVQNPVRLGQSRLDNKVKKKTLLV